MRIKEMISKDKTDKIWPFLIGRLTLWSGEPGSESNMAKNARPFSEEILAEFVENCEQTELDGLATTETYAQLLAVYLLQNDLPNAKFLWKRIPEDVKLSANELQKIWNVGCKMWLKDYSGIYGALRQDWSATIQTIMGMLQSNIQDHLFELVQKAYTSIHVDNFSVFVGMDAENALQVARNHNWQYDSTTKMLSPVKPTSGSVQSPDISITSNTQLGILTDYVTFLEH